jgi:drug/metabolite transporter (DMT)-like permease
VILSVLVLGERLTLAAAGGVVLTVTGVVLASGRADPVGREGARATGVVFGLAAALCYGVGGFLLGRYTREFGWLVPVVVARIGAMVVLLGLLTTPLRRATASQCVPGVAWAVGAGAGRRGRGGILRPG